jgi:hypothetical protein
MCYSFPSHAPELNLHERMPTVFVRRVRLDVSPYLRFGQFAFRLHSWPLLLTKRLPRCRKSYRSITLLRTHMQVLYQLINGHTFATSICIQLASIEDYTHLAHIASQISMFNRTQMLPNALTEI